MPSDDTKGTPAATGVVHDRQAEAVAICRDVFAGTLRIREESTKYLPQFPKEEDDAYEDRKESSVLYNAFRRTVKGLTGMVFRKDPQIGEDVPTPIAAQLENVDLTGRDLPTFARDLFEDGMIDGHGHLFVDMQEVDEEDEPRSLLEEERAGLRPYWVDIRKQDVLRFRTVNVGGEKVVTSFAYQETVVVADGEFDEREERRIRQYDLTDIADEGEEPTAGVAFRVWREKKDAQKKENRWERIKSGTMTIPRIPLVTFYADRKAFMESEPPLLDLALENIKHYQVRSDNDNLAHVAKVPIPLFTGVDKKELATVAIGPNLAVVLEPEKAKGSYLQADGSSMEAFLKQEDKIEHRMALLGLSMLMSESRAAETATSKEIDKSESDSQLATAARGLQQALVEAMQLHAEWLDLDDGGQIGVNMDFKALTIAPQLLKVIADMVPSKLSHETLWDIMEKGEVLPEAFDPEIELDRLEFGTVATLDRLRGEGGNGGEPEGAGAGA